MDFSTYKACLFDVDKTLTTSEKKISEKTIQSLHALQKNGLKSGVCTGRHALFLQDWVLPLFQRECVHITAGGAQLVGSDGSVLWEHLIPVELVQQIISIGSRERRRIDVYFANSYYCSMHDLKAFSASGSENIVLKPITDFSPVAVPIISIYDINNPLIEDLSLIPDLTIKQMRNYNNRLYVDITAKGVTKATAVEQWCKITGIHPEEIVGFGDSENDIEFLQTVGYSVAMGNATDSVKAIADEVTDDCDHDGVAKWIEKNILR